MDESSRTSRTFHAAGLSRARSLFRKMVKYFICLPTDRLWELYSLNYRLLAEVKSCLDEIGWLSNEREWDNTNGEKINREHFAGWSEGVSQVKTFVFFSYLFNMVLEYHQLCGCGTSVKETIRTGFVEPGPTGTSEHSPDAFLHMAVKTPSTPGKSRWRDLIYLFKYKFGDDDAVNVSQPESLAYRDHLLIHYRTTTWHC